MRENIAGLGLLGENIGEAGHLLVIVIAVHANAELLGWVERNVGVHQWRERRNASV